MELGSLLWCKCFKLFVGIVFKFMIVNGSVCNLWIFVIEVGKV